MSKIYKINFIDGSTKAFAIDVNAPVQQLKQLIVTKLTISVDTYFSLFEKKGEWERCLEPDEKLADLEGDLIFKKSVYIKTDESEMLDLNARDLVYKQAVYHVINSDYSLTVEEAIKLAGFQMQVNYEEFHSDIHKTGFLTTNDSWKNFIPKSMCSSKRPTEWESLILKMYSNLPKKLSPDAAKKEYIDLIKNNDNYGTTFFPPVKPQNNRNLPNKVVIGVNSEGIRIYKPKVRDSSYTYPFTEICCWSSSGSTFAFEWGNTLESQKFTFETKHGAIISSTIQTYIDILVQMLKSDDDAEDATTSLSEP